MPDVPPKSPIYQCNSLEVETVLLILSIFVSEETKENIARAEEDMRKGRVHKWEDVKRELDIDV